MGQSTVAEPAIAALLPQPPAGADAGAVVTTADGTTLVNGNIKVVLAAATGLVNVTRVSDGAGDPRAVCGWYLVSKK